MAAESPRLGIPYPSDRGRSWYEDFVAFVTAVDAALFAALGLPHLLRSGGGTLSWNAGTGVLSWDEAFVFSMPTTGFQWTLPAGSVTIPDGSFVVFAVTHGVTANVSVTAVVTTTITDHTSAVALCRRLGTTILFHGGHLIVGTRDVEASDLFGQALTEDELDAVRGASTPTAANPFATMADVSGGGSSNPEFSLGGGGVRTGLDGGAAEIIGTYWYDPAEHTGVTAGTLRCEGWTTAAYTGTVDLYDPTSSTVLASLTLLSTTPGIPLAADDALSALPGSSRMLWVRASAPAGVVGDTFRVLRTSLLLT